jgi:hypothetical protein
MITTWNILGTIAIIALVLSFFIGKNAIWGGLTLGAIIGVIVTLISFFIGDGFNRTLVKEIAIVSVLLGAVFEIIGRLSKKRV